MKSLTYIGIVLLFWLLYSFAPMVPSQIDNITSNIWRFNSGQIVPLTENDTIIIDSSYVFDSCLLDYSMRFDTTGLVFVFQDSAYCDYDSLFFEDSAYWSFYENETKLLIQEASTFDTIDSFNVIKLTIDSFIISKNMIYQNWSYLGTFKYVGDQ